MGVLQNIGDAMFGKRIVDPFFGQLQFDRTEMLTRPGQPRSRKYFQYWLGRLQFEPTGTEVGVCLPADETGPTEDQRSVFRELASRWTSMIDPLTDALYPEYRQWFAETPAHQMPNPQEVFQLLELVGFQIEHPTLYPSRKQYQDCEINFSVAGLGAHDLVAHVKNWSVIQASIE